MTGTTVLPAPKPVKDMLTDLLGRDVTVAPSDPVPTGEKHPIAVGVFVDDSMRMGALAVMDLPMAAYCSAAIGLVPVGGAEAAIEDRELPKSLQDNLYEVLNIMSALFNVPGAPHLRLHASYPPGEIAPNDVAAVVRTLGMRLDQDVTIAGYGIGRLSLVLAP